MASLVFFRSLKVVASLFVIILVLVLGYYYIWVQGKQRTYLVSRNLRQLRNYGLQITETIDVNANVIKNIIINSPKKKSEPELRRKTFLGFRTLEPGDPKNRAASAEWRSVKAFESDPAGGWSLLIKYFDVEDGKFRGSVSLDPGASLAQLVNDNGVFDAIQLAASDGSVIFHTGNDELNVARLDALIPSGQKFADSTRAPNNILVNVSDSNYRLFIQPCCSGLKVRTKAQDGATLEPGLVMCGLISEQRFTYSTLAISFSVLALIAGMMLLTIFSWPFLKLVLMGHHQRVRMADVLLLALCSLLGIAVVTIFWLDLTFYSKLKSDVNEHLKSFATSIEQNLQRELRLAYYQLRCLEGDAKNRFCNPPKGITVDGKPDAQASADSHSISLVHAKSTSSGNHNSTPKLSVENDKEVFYPFDEWFLINREGRIFRKYAWDTPRPMISVADRSYFRQAQNASGTWRLLNDEGEPDENLRYALGLVRSRTTGEPRAVIATPAKPPEVEKKPQADGNVVGLSIPLRSLINPAVLEGYGYAIIDQQGKVVFHSDERHTSGENFFEEVDGDSRLKALIALKRSDWLNLRYFGEGYLAYVTPIGSLPDVPWSLVTFHNKQLVQTINTEWLLGTMLFVTAYAGIYLFIGILIACISPRFRATWIWPDRTKRNTYLRLIVVFLAIIATELLLLWIMRGLLLLVAGLCLPFVVWLIAYLVLRRYDGQYPEPGRERSHLILSYQTFTILLLVLVVVMPTLMFFRASYDSQIDSFIRYEQFRFGQAFEVRTLELSSSGSRSTSSDQKAPRYSLATFEQELSKKNRDSYVSFFYQTTVASPSPGASPECPKPDGVKGRLTNLANPMSAKLPEIVSSQFPLYSSLSVQMRELASGEPADRSWRWCSPKSSELVFEKTQRGKPTFIMRSTAPNFWDAVNYSLSSGRGRAVLATSLVSLAALLYCVVQFVCRRIFLIDIWKPIFLTSKKTISLDGSRNLFITYSRDCQRDALLDRGKIKIDIDITTWTEPLNEWPEKLRDTLEKAGPNRCLVIGNFEHRNDNHEQNLAKFWLIEELVRVQARAVVILSKVTPESLVRSTFSIEDGKSQDLSPKTAEKRQVPLLSEFNWIDMDSESQQGIPRQRSRKRTINSALRRQLAAESKRHTVLNRAWRDVKPQTRAADAPYILEEYDERVASYYGSLWSSCTEGEKLVLRHLAQDGFLNHKDRRIIRRLYARGFIHRAPHFKLMDDAFRRFVLSAKRPVKDIESISPWDSFKQPFLVVLLVIITFIFVTQQELFKVTIATVTGVTAALPVLLKLFSVLTNREQ